MSEGFGFLFNLWFNRFFLKMRIRYPFKVVHKSLTFELDIWCLTSDKVQFVNNFKGHLPYDLMHFTSFSLDYGFGF